MLSSWLLAKLSYDTVRVSPFLTVPCKYHLLRHCSICLPPRDRPRFSFALLSSRSTAASRELQSCCRSMNVEIRGSMGSMLTPMKVLPV